MIEFLALNKHDDDSQIDHKPGIETIEQNAEQAVFDTLIAEIDSAVPEDLRIRLEEKGEWNKSGSGTDDDGKVYWIQTD